MITRLARRTALFSIASMTACFALGAFVAQEREGSHHTPILPGQKWHVNDADRPYPHEVTPGTPDNQPPSDAVVLFDGKDLSHWVQMDNGLPGGHPVPPRWKITDGVIEVVPRTGDMYSSEKFGDSQIHIEWQEPKGIVGRGQGRGNSGIFVMGRFEVQVLDSYRAATYADGQAGAIYGQWPPLVNPMRPPGEWQSYDIVFTAPKFADGKLLEPAYETVFFNGVLIHNHQKLNGPTANGIIPAYIPNEVEGRLRIQDHDSTRTVRFRNIWVRRLKGYDQPEEPMRRD